LNKRPFKFVVYGRLYCHLCDDMVAALRARLAGADFSVEVIDVDADPALEKQFGEWVPVLFANGERLCHYHLDALKVDEYLRNFG
jgi:hypothetical protein